MMLENNFLIKMPFIKFTFILLLILYSCHIRDFKNDNGITDTEKISHFVQFYRDDKLIASFNVELSITSEERQRGLMYRDILPDNYGMLFIFDNESNHTFWMKNTYIPLDLIFISNEKKIVGIYKNATPLSEKSISVERPSRYVLEINAGLSDKYGIDENSRAVFINIF